MMYDKDSYASIILYILRKHYKSTIFTYVKSIESTTLIYFSYIFVY